MNNPNNPSSHDGLLYREVPGGGGGSSDPETDPGTGLDEIRQRAAAIGSTAQSIIAQAMSDNSTKYLEDVTQKGGQ